MNVSIDVLPLPEDKKAKLRERGFLFVNDLQETDARIILSDLNRDDINECKQKPIIQSALQIWKAEATKPHIATFSSQLDKILGGGVELQMLTDFCGAPGTGKTQLCLQLCVAVQLPQHFGGLEGQALFIDTSRGVTKSRLQEIAEGCVKHCEYTQKESGGTFPSVSQLLSGVRILTTPGETLEELLSALTTLPDCLQSLPQVRLLVIDSFSKPFLLYCDSEQLMKRTALICDILSRLQNLAAEFNIAVVTTSQLTTTARPNGEMSVVPGLGQGFAHRVTHRVMLGLVQTASGSRRAANVIKSPSQPRQSGYFQILKSGISDEGCS